MVGEVGSLYVVLVQIWLLVSVILYSFYCRFEYGSNHRSMEAMLSFNWFILPEHYIYSFVYWSGHITEIKLFGRYWLA